MLAHILVIILGCMKEALDLDKEIHTIHSTVETIVACLVIIVRQLSAWKGYKDIKVHRSKMEYIDTNKGGQIKSLAIEQMMKAYTVVFMVILSFNIIAFICLYFADHLAWTVLTNNFSLVMVMALDAPLRQRMQAEMALITEDHQKAVLYETSLLLEEAMKVAEGKTREQVKTRVDKFLYALKDTDAFKQPDYIRISEDCKPQEGLNMLTTMSAIS